MLNPAALNEPAILLKSPARSQVQILTEVQPRSVSFCQFTTGVSARSSSAICCRMNWCANSKSSSTSLGECTTKYRGGRLAK